MSYRGIAISAWSLDGNKEPDGARLHYGQQAFDLDWDQARYLSAILRELLERNQQT